MPMCFTVKITLKGQFNDMLIVTLLATNAIGGNAELLLIGAPLGNDDEDDNGTAVRGGDTFTSRWTIFSLLGAK